MNGDLTRSRRGSLPYDYWLRFRHRRPSVRSIINSFTGKDPPTTTTATPTNKPEHPVTLCVTTVAESFEPENRPHIRGNDSRNATSTRSINGGVHSTVSFEKNDLSDFKSNEKRKSIHGGSGTNPPPQYRSRHSSHRMSLPCVLSALKKSQVPPGLISRALSSEDGAKSEKSSSHQCHQAGRRVVSADHSDTARSRRAETGERSIQGPQEKLDDTRPSPGSALRSVNGPCRQDTEAIRPGRLSTCREAKDLQNGPAPSDQCEISRALSVNQCDAISPTDSPLPEESPPSQNTGCSPAGDRGSVKVTTCTLNSRTTTSVDECKTVVTESKGKSTGTRSQCSPRPEPARSRSRSRLAGTADVTGHPAPGVVDGQAQSSAGFTNPPRATTTEGLASRRRLTTCANDNGTATSGDLQSKRTATAESRLTSSRTIIGVADRLRLLEEKRCGKASTTAPAIRTATTAAATTASITSSCDRVSVASRLVQEPRRYSKSVIPQHLRPRTRSEDLDLGGLKSYRR